MITAASEAFQTLSIQIKVAALFIGTMICLRLKEYKM